VRERDRRQHPEQVEAAPAIPDRQASQLIDEDPARAVEHWANELAHSHADQQLLSGHRSVSQPTLVPAVNSGRRIATRRAHRLVGDSSSVDADHPLLMG